MWLSATPIFYKNGQRKVDHDKVLEKYEECTKQILEAKKDYILKMTKKLTDSNTSSKSYWTILNRLLYNKKLPTIPLPLVNGKMVSDFGKKANIFNNFFASICTPIDNTSCLPSFSYRTGSRIKSFQVTENDILAIIKSLDPNKAHGCDNISIKMIKICSQSLILLLKIIFEHSLKKGKFPKIWKKVNIVLVHKKENKMLVKNYRPISLLPIFGKMFERVIYNSLFNYFQSNRLFTPFQSGFLPGDSCIAQLLSIIHEIQTAFDENPTVDISGVFLDISKNVVEGELFSLLKNYLENREQRVALNGQTSEWRKIMSGVPQGSVLGPILFLIYINDLPDGINSLCKIFADDTSLFSKIYYDIHNSANKLNDDLEKISYCTYQWKMKFNPDPNKQANEVIFSRKTNSNNLPHPPIKFNKIDISECPHQKHLGIVLDSILNFNAHIDQKSKSATE